MTTKISFNDTLQMLEDKGQTISNVALQALSNLELEPENLAKLEKTWPTLEIERRQKTVAALVELAEEDVQLNFSAVLLMALSTDSDPKVRGKAIEGLWEDETIEALNKLVFVLANDSDETVRERAAIGLSRFAYLAEVGKLKERFVQKLRNALFAQLETDQISTTVGRRAIEALGYFGEEEAVIKLIEKAYASDDEFLKSSALKAMGRSVNRRWLPEIGKELSSNLPALRYEAATAAGELATEELLTPLMRLLNDRDQEVKLATIWALGQIGGPEPTRRLKELVSDENEVIVEAANEALAEIAFNKDALNILGRD